MRGRSVAALVLATAATLAMGCKKPEAIEEGAGIQADAMHGPPPSRVVQAVPDGLFTNPTDAGSAGPQPEPGNSGLMGQPDARRPDARADARADTALPDAAGTCDVLRQNCPRKSDGCYPGSGAGYCALVQQAGQENASCFEHDQCNVGSACIRENVAGSGFCRKFCNTASPTRDVTCVRCVALANMYPAGYCAP